jgi:hypothetical protein
MKGTIFTTSKQQFVDVPLRFNIYNDEIEFKTPENEIFALAAPEIVEMVEFGDCKMVYVPFSNVKKIRYGFFKVEEEGKASLYSKLEMTYKPAVPPAAFKNPVPPKFVHQPDSHYIQIGKEQAEKVRKKKKIVEIFPKHQNEILSFIKTNKIKTNKAEDLIKLVRYYNTL